MRFTSENAGMTIFVLDENVAYSADGQKRVIPSADGKRSGPQVYADFGQGEFAGTFGEEVQITGLDGSPDWAPDIRHGIYDTDEAARLNGWTDFEKAEVERRLLELCPNGPAGDNPTQRRVPGYGYVRLYEVPVPTPPWPNYDKLVAGGRGVTAEAVAEKIAELASSFGCVPEALVYEQRTKARESVLEKLQELLAKEQGAEALVVP